MNDDIYWIWLLKCFGSAAAIDDIIRYFGSARGLYEAGSTEWRLSGLLTAKQIAALSKWSPSQSGDVLKACRENGWEILTPQSIYYPQRLREIRNFPPVLFLKGDKEVLLRDVKLSIVGTRRASNYGLRVARLLAEALSEAGAVVVSGGALGVDSAAHAGALHAHGKTIAVLGCGLGTDYLRENADLRKEISRNGALISEFLPFSPASRTTFPLRNRIISALSLGTVVVEAGEKSGSLITARLALEQGRDVFAVPGDIVSSAFTGANKLIHDGAKPVFTPLDILEEYVYTYPEEINTVHADRTLGEMLRHGEQSAPHRFSAQVGTAKTAVPNTARPHVPLPESATGTAQSVYAALDTARHIDELSEKTGLPVSACLSALTELELYGCVRLTEGKKYEKV